MAKSLRPKTEEEKTEMIEFNDQQRDRDQDQIHMIGRIRTQNAETEKEKEIGITGHDQGIGSMYEFT